MKRSFGSIGSEAEDAAVEMPDRHATVARSWTFVADHSCSSMAAGADVETLKEVPVVAVLVEAVAACFAPHAMASTFQPSRESNSSRCRNRPPK